MLQSQAGGKSIGVAAHANATLITDRSPNATSNAVVNQSGAVRSCGSASPADVHFLSF